MFDTVDLRLRGDEVKNVDFLSETPCYFDVRGNHSFSGNVVVSGYIDDCLKVTASNQGVKVSGGSMCKWMLGDNLQTMGRKEVQQAIERLSDALHLPFKRSEVTRIDVAQNFIVRHEPSAYTNQLGEAQYYTRLEQPSSIYYQNSKRQLVFYDKVKEVRASRGVIPEIYQGRQTLRYEMRLKGRLREQLRLPQVTGDMLFNEKFYTGIIDKWYNEYKAIRKLNTITINYTNMTSRKEIYKIAVQRLANEMGGQAAVVNQVSEAYKAGALTKKQAYDIRSLFKEAFEASGSCSESDAIAELDQKVKQAVRFYR